MREGLLAYAHVRVKWLELVRRWSKVWYLSLNQESTDSARKAVEKLQADGKLVQMAKVIATVMIMVQLGVWRCYLAIFWCFIQAISSDNSVIGWRLKPFTLETRRRPDKYLFLKFARLDWRQGTAGNAGTIWWCRLDPNPPPPSKFQRSQGVKILCKVTVKWALDTQLGKGLKILSFSWYAPSSRSDSPGPFLSLWSNHTSKMH